jgi:hypothetical protein
MEACGRIWWTPLTLTLAELSLESLKCKGSWEMLSYSVPRKRTGFSELPADLCHSCCESHSMSAESFLSLFCVPCNLYQNYSICKMLYKASQDHYFK